MSTHTISVFVENRHGALSRIAGLFSSRGYNITSLTVAETEDPSTSRMTIVVAGDESVLEQVVKQLNRLIDVIKVIDFVKDPVIDREIILVRLDATKSTRHEIVSLASIFGGTVAAISPTSITIELTGTSQTIGDFISMVKPYGIKELVRSGKVAMAQARK
ncbi:MAG: acetolactate synthase small subunit [Chitinivibrionales bacterium]|nr:acetolactate synthase small subunit [Chitinivibrionales bacterium]MBD3395609.1 acetolactate synthase small subunit [Chitinivibrionales bacterium]